MKIGIFGGAFNPVHNGHISIARQYMKYLELDKIIFIPTCVPPHKSGDDLAPGEDRINMLRCALDCEEFVISDLEFHRQGKSYTYDTLQELKKTYKNDELFLIVGSDQYFYFPNWYRAQDILSEVTVVTSAREENEYNALLEFRGRTPCMQNTVISNLDVFEASSTQIRNMIKSSKDVSNLVPIGVYEYIKEHKLYV